MTSDNEEEEGFTPDPREDLNAADQELRKMVLGKAYDAGVDFFDYDRENDEDLSEAQLDDAIHRGLVTMDEIAAAFRD